MELLEAIKGRRSIRQFTTEPVPQEDIEEILDAARWAPSGSNQQMWKFIVVKNKEILEKMSRAISEEIDKVEEKLNSDVSLQGNKKNATFFAQAPVTIAVFMVPYESKFNETLKTLGYSTLDIQRLRGQAELQSIGAAVQNLLLAAYAKGYGTCWMCAPNIASPEIEKILGVDEKWTLKALVPLGKPVRVPKPPKRKELNEIMEVKE